ncbi:MAG TPA: quinone-dependent dihydroorotate dehydrogenase [Salinivirgaceae bacterium]|nr:quinone-dependent dihydroorotate dehydrogenase [Salinivirgaceae bacterium]
MYSIIRQILFTLPPEKAHHFTISSLKSLRLLPGAQSLLHSIFFRQNPVQHMGITFPNRIGLAAGLDKDGVAADLFHHLGFGFVEIGTVTPKAQPGNPKPRLFRIPKDKALINRMGFNNDGLEKVIHHLQRYQNRNFVLGGNIGKNTITPNEKAIEDYLECLEGLYPWVDYLVLNVSCPNIQNLSQLQNADELGALMAEMSSFRMQQVKYKPMLVKLSPDLTDENIEQSISLVHTCGFDGVIFSNTTVTRDQLSISSTQITQIGQGGLSGKPLLNRNLSKISRIKLLLNDKTLIGCGGILTENDAKQYLDAGADLIQVYTGFIYSGPSLIKKIAALQK